MFFPILFALSCDKSSHKEDAVFAAIRAQIKALNHRDAAGAMAMMHPDAPGIDKTRETTEFVTSNYDLLYMIENLTLESMSEDEAKVRFTELTQKVSGPEIPGSGGNNRVVGVHTLRKYNGDWKIYYTQVLKIDYLSK